MVFSWPKPTPIFLFKKSLKWCQFQHKFYFSLLFIVTLRKLNWLKFKTKLSNSATAFLSNRWHHPTVRYYKSYAYHVTLNIMWLRTFIPLSGLEPTLYLDGHETFSWYAHWETDISSPSHWRPDITTASTASTPSFLQMGFH